jgi:hypothetical protein
MYSLFIWVRSVFHLSVCCTACTRQRPHRWQRGDVNTGVSSRNSETFTVLTSPDSVTQHWGLDLHKNTLRWGPPSHNLHRRWRQIPTSPQRCHCACAWLGLRWKTRLEPTSIITYVCQRHRGYSANYLGVDGEPARHIPLFTRQLTNAIRIECADCRHVDICPETGECFSYINLNTPLIRRYNHN